MILYAAYTIPCIRQLRETRRLRREATASDSYIADEWMGVKA